MGNTLKNNNQLEEAIEAYQKAIAINPDYAEAYNNMGATLHSQSKLEEALEVYSEALALKPDYAEASYNMGTTLKDYGELEEALEAYNKALSLKPDYTEAYIGVTGLLKIYTPEKQLSHVLFRINDKIKDLSSELFHAKSNEEIISNLVKGLDHISEDSYSHRTRLSQIFNQSSVDLNCHRHFKIFNEDNIIPEFCFGCFKVQVEVDTLLDLIKVTALFYQLDFGDNLTRKTMVELRPNMSGFYKGLIYCRGLDQATEVKKLLDAGLRKKFNNDLSSTIKRGCSEYPLKFPEYGEISSDPQEMMNYPDDWKHIEEKFDEKELIKPKESMRASLQEFCLSDFYIIQKWIDYAKGIGDQSIKVFEDRPIIYQDIYDKAKERTVS